MTANPRRQWLIPTALILLTLVPMVAGSVRLAELSTGPEVTADNARYVADPLPVVLHIISACVYCVLGAFQFIPGPRSRGRRWHRYSGRLLVPTGILAAVTGVWMTLGYPSLPGDGLALLLVRLVVGSAMVAAIVLGLVAVRRRRFAEHRAWMIRAYAIGQGAGTQVFTHLPWAILVGEATGTPRLVFMIAGWLINAVFAEWIIRRRRRPAVSTHRPLVTLEAR
jgi:uncharacterized membrane protein